ncbi:DUF1643 domain-containing protein [Synechococcus sp. RSCCF101]|uniref:DUF1643 domain-containing protein n=1 Tax=Synechococcus sp. RSCCF101 TaxID=2511069 RepID=UPI0017827B3A|nr:DUF1643 domain-containing protein [Synechococcus sp. RSCCF101]
MSERDPPPLFALCSEADNGAVRVLLGTGGDAALIVLGLNPSTADQHRSDPTVRRVAAVATGNGFNGFVLANLYPLRATDPRDLPQQADPRLLAHNQHCIDALVRANRERVIWAAWGEGIALRRYLADSLAALACRLRPLSCRWIHHGPITRHGHPRHPARLAYRWAFSPFNVQSYVEHLGRNRSAGGPGDTP